MPYNRTPIMRVRKTAADGTVTWEPLRGPRGKSAYDVYLDNGGTLSEAEFTNAINILPNVSGVVNIIKTNGNGTKYLADDGTYKTISGSARIASSDTLDGYSLGSDTTDIKSSDTLNQAFSKLMKRVKNIEGEIQSISTSVTRLESSSL